MKKLISFVLVFVIILGSVGNVFAVEKRSGVADVEQMDLKRAEEIAYLDLETASEEMQEEILEARELIIFNNDWVADGFTAFVTDAEGVSTELPHFSELFPGWDLPVDDSITEKAPTYNDRAIGDDPNSSSWHLEGTTTLYLYHPGSSNSPVFGYKYMDPSTVGTAMRITVDLLTASEHCNIGYTNMVTGQSIAYRTKLSMGTAFTIYGIGNMTVGARASTYSYTGWSTLSAYTGEKEIWLSFEETE